MTGTEGTELEIDIALDAGAVLPDGTPVAERRDTASTRSYLHPALTGRTVVRLTADALGSAEDLTMEFLGFAPAAEPVRAGVVRQQALGFPAWALVHDPANGHHALNLVKDIERLTRLATTKPGHAKEGFDLLADRLAGAVPHFLPTYYEQAARAFLAAENNSMAASCFGKARAAERAHGLAIDEIAQGASFLEFALAGALTAKALTEYARALAARVTPDAAYAQFRRICLERVASGLPPYTAMPADLRRLAKAARCDNAAEDALLARELLALPATTKASAGFWAAYRTPLIRAARIDARVRGLLLATLPTMPGEARDVADNLWLGFLYEAGAVSGLVDPPEQVPAEARSADGAVGWLNRFTAHSNRGQSWRYRSGERLNQRLLSLVERMAPRLLAEGTPVVLCESRGADLDVIDLCLTLGIEVAEPSSSFAIGLESWLSGGSARELSALAADPRPRPYLYRALDALARAEAGAQNQSSELAEAVDRVTGAPGLRSVLSDWLADRAEALAAGGLVDLEEGLRLMNRVADPRILAVNPDAVRRIIDLDVAPFLGQALRAGIFDEYGWPALEEACARLAGLAPGADPQTPAMPTSMNQRSPFRRGYARSGENASWQLTGQWPYLVLQQEARAAVIDADGTRLEHTITFPPSQNGSGGRANNIYNVILRYVDGQLLVLWHGYPDSGAYWTGDPTALFTSDVTLHYENDSLELPWGGRTFGGRPLVAGSTNWSAPGPVISDGTDYWVRITRDRVQEWVEFDPRTGVQGRTSLPAFFAKQVTVTGEWKVRVGTASLRPAGPGTVDSPLGQSAGLVGFRTYVAPDGTQICEGIDGRTATVARVDGTGTRRSGTNFGNRRQDAIAVGVLDFPGAAQRQAMLYVGGDLQLVIEEHKRTAILVPGRQSTAYARGTWCVPPLEYWHYLTVRDPEGSASLRELTDETARTLLDRSAQLAGDTAFDLFGEVLPKVVNTRLRSGIAGYAGVAESCVKQLAALRGRFEETGAQAAPVTSATDLRWDETFRSARNGLCPTSLYRGAGTPTPEDAIRLLTELFVPAAAPPGSSIAQLQLTDYSVKGMWLETLQAGFALPALAFRAASPATGSAQRRALLDFLELWDASGLRAPGTALRLLTVKSVKDPQRDTAGGTVVETAHGRAIVFTRADTLNNGETLWFAAEFSRDGQFADVPDWTILVDGRVIPWPSPDWARAGAVGELCRQVRAEGPAPIRPEQAANLSEAGGLNLSEAKVLLAGLPTEAPGYSEQVPIEVRELLGLSATALKTAAKRFARLDVWQKSPLVGSLLPESVDALWQTGPRLDVAIASWISLFGKQTPIPEALIAAAEKASSAGLVQALLSPSEATWLGGAVVVNPATAEVSRRYDFSTGHVDSSAAGLAWLAYHLPTGDPLRAALPQALALIRERLAAPALKIRAGHTRSAPALIAALGHEQVKSGDDWRVGPLGLGANFTNWCPVDLYPADLSGPDDPVLLLFERDSDFHYARSKIVALRLLLGERLPALLEHGQPQPGVEPFPAQDPTRSVPGLVAEAADQLDLGSDAAALYLMLLALPDPTDRNQADWTGWKPARLKAARAELAAAKTAEGDLVVSGTRERAGRTLFLPGPWHALKAPYLPLEAWKAPALGVEPDATVPLGVIVPRIPVADLYAAAWQRVRSGDGPRYHELTTGKKK